MAREYESAAELRGCAFIPINLTCQAAENERRLRTPERLDSVAGGKGMLTDCEILRNYRARSEIHQFQCSEALNLDITVISPSQAASQVIQHIEKVLGQKLQIRPNDPLRFS